MKKLLLFLGVLILSQLQISIEPKEVLAKNLVNESIIYGETIESFTQQKDGMIYRIFIYHGSNSAGDALFVTNVTKDKLEVEKLKLEIKALKK